MTATAADLHKEFPVGLENLHPVVVGIGHGNSTIGKDSHSRVPKTLFSAPLGQFSLPLWGNGSLFQNTFWLNFSSVSTYY